MPEPLSDDQKLAPRGLLARWNATPLYLRILIACLIGVVVGVGLRELDRAWHPNESSVIAWYQNPRLWAEWLRIPSRLIVRHLLTALAAPLVLVAVIQALMQAKIPKGNGVRLIGLLLLNTTVAILIGLTVANVLQPGKRAGGVEKNQTEVTLKTDPLQQILENVPRSLLGPFTDDGKITSVIMIAVALGIGMRRLPPDRFQRAAEFVETAFDVLLIILHWVIELIPLAVFGIVASIVATQGFEPFQKLATFVVSVLVGLGLHLTYYLVRIRLGSWCRPLAVLRGMRDALLMAFSTASSTATMPVTYACLREKVGLREQSASLGALVGANFNNDGTALYQAMAAVFVAQLTLDHPLTLMQQVLVVLTAIAASVGAAGIPEAGTVTMAMIFKAIGLDPNYIAVLLTVDWFLDRCRTAINIMGDVNVSCLLDGYTRETHLPTEQDRELAEIA